MDLHAPLIYRRLLAIVASLGILPTAANEVPPESERWQFRGSGTEVVEHLGRTAIRLGESGAAWLPEVSFESGIVEFDLAVGTERGFPGVAFRIVDMGNYEHFYLRPHQSGNPDANQYTPVFNRATGWQIYYGPEYSAPTRYRSDDWMRVRIEVAEDSARVYLDSEQPILEIGDLKRDRQPGSVALLNTGGAAYFSNFRVDYGPVTSARKSPPPELPDGIVRVWSVSPAMSEAAAYDFVRDGDRTSLRWSALETETNGIANLGRVATWTPETPTALTRILLQSDRARTVRMRYGFSDRVRLYLNGTALVDGDDTYATRDYRFLGTVGLHDAVHLPLRAGRNEIMLVVTEVFGGWAAMAAFDELEGLELGSK
jgi:hypothetical protein